MSTISCYQWIKTGDGSPSLVWDEKEAMHNKAGAWSETQYVYGEALRSSLRSPSTGSYSNSTTDTDTTTEDFSVFILGLGLGYLELMSVAEFLKQNSQTRQTKKKKLKLLTFESDSFLKDAFIAWLKKDKNQLSPIFNEIDPFLIRDYPGLPIKESLLEAYNQGDWTLQGELNLEVLSTLSNGQKFSYILYDAFSKKSTPSLWSPEFLTQFLQKIPDSQCRFATYACTGDLRRALAAQGFEVVRRAGYSGKRQCTLALKTGL